MKVVNLTPHAVTVLGGVAPQVFPAPDKGTLIPRVDFGAPQVVQDLTDALGVPVSAQGAQGVVVGLPDPVSGTLYLVSMAVRAACPSRTDLVSPGTLVRGPDGQPTGCQGLVVNPSPRA